MRPVDDVRPATITLADLLRWEEHGAGWWVIDSGEAEVVLELRQCTGEPVTRVRGSEPALISHVVEQRDR